MPPAGEAAAPALGLRWRNVDLEAGRVRITVALQWAGARFDFAEPKTARGRRTVALPPMTIELLRRVRREQAERRLLLGPAWHDLDLVVERGDGWPLRTDSTSQGFAKLAKAAGVPGVRYHDLRHGFATALLVAGVHPKVVSEALGHASIAFTLDTYSHVLPSVQDATAAAIEAALAGVP